METNIAKRGALTLLLTAALALACAIFATPAVAHAEEASDSTEGIVPTSNSEFHISSANESLLALRCLVRETPPTGRFILTATLSSATRTCKIS